MRISNKDRIGLYASVYLDGVKLTRCVQADSDQGWALCGVEGDKGPRSLVSAVRTLPGPGQVDWEGILCEYRYGKVEIRFDLPGLR